MIEAEPLRGRSRFAEMYREVNPDITDETDDEALWGFIDERYSDVDGKYNELANANTRLMEAVRRDPRSGVILSMMADSKSPKSLLYGIAKMYGKDFLSKLSDRELEDIDAADAEWLAEEEKRRANESLQVENLKQYEANLARFAQDNGLTPEQENEIHNGVIQVANDLFNGIVSEQILDLVYKGLNYDRDIDEAIATGKVEGLNEQISEKMRSVAPVDMPLLSNNTGAGLKKSAPKTRGSFYDSIEEVKM